MGRGLVQLGGQSKQVEGEFQTEAFQTDALRNYSPNKKKEVWKHCCM